MRFPRLDPCLLFALLFTLLAGCALKEEAPPPPAPPPAPAPVQAPAPETPPPPEPLAEEVPDFGADLVFQSEPAFGDLSTLLERRTLRILVPYSRTFFFIDQGQQRGVIAEFGDALEIWLNARHKLPGRPLSVVFIPTRRDLLLTNLVAGLGDIAVGDLTVTPGRERIVDFSVPFSKEVDEVVVTGPGAPKLASIEDLSGQDVFVRRSSSYHEHLTALNARLKAAGKAPARLRAAPEDLEDEDILEMVNAGLVKIAMVDDYLGEFWSQIYDRITLREDLVINTEGAIAWGMRKGSPQLKAELDEFIRTHGLHTSFGSALFKRFLRSTKYVTGAVDVADRQRFTEYVGLFAHYGEKYDFDHLMLVAQGYQESGLDQSARNPSGAVGIMQILPSTAESPPIGISGVDKDAEKNIHAGTKYLRHLVEVYLDEPGIDEQNRLLLAFAGYNAGPGNLRKIRRLAEKNGLDPNVWFYNVELAAARVIGQETVRYVANIYKYYLAYRLVTEHDRHREDARGKVTGVR